VGWSAGEGLSGDSILLPEHATVTSRWGPERPGTARYALVCRPDEPLRLEDHGELRFGTFAAARPSARRKSRAVVRQDPVRLGCGRAYRVALRASLVRPYVLRLSAPELIGWRDGATPQPASLAL
jgi:hypothetical protein